MCYSIYISTDSRSDLAAKNNELIEFTRMKDKSENSSISLLSFENVWHVGSRSNCSCGFRHLLSHELGFSEPVDWYEEDEQDLEATKQVYLIFRGLVEDGCSLDCVDKWEGADLSNIVSIEVSVREVGAAEFRFFENYYFVFIE